MKLAVVFPGIGYHTDKPLLYYSKRLARAQGYELRDVPYGGFAQGIKGSPEKMRAAFDSALAQTETLLRDVDFAQYDELLFLSKSVGTCVAAAYAARHGLTTRNVYYTPLAETFALDPQPGIVFHGTADPWAETPAVQAGCAAHGLPLYTVANANHSLETGDVLPDLQNLHRIMAITQAYLAWQPLPPA